MSRRETTLDPQVAAELEQLDAALAGARVDDAELEALVRDVRALAPVIDPRFQEQLGKRAAESFPREQRRRSLGGRWPSTFRHWRALAPALGVAASVLLVVIVAVSLPGDRSEPGGANGGSAASRESSPASAAVDSEAGGGSSAGGSATAATPEPAPPSDAQADRADAPRSDDKALSSVPPLPLDPGAEAPNAQRRKVERAATLSLTTSGDGLQKASDGIVRVTQDLGGYVASSQVNTTERGGEASFRLRVPSARLSDVIARLSRLAHVRSLDQSATDITGPFASTTDRLLDARAERRGLQRALENATDADEIAVLRARLRVVTQRVAVLQAELNALRRRADLSTIDVTVTGRGAARDEQGAGGWTPGDAWRDAVRVLEVSASVALVALALAIPLGLAVALAAAGTRAVRRRRREAALDVV